MRARLGPELHVEALLRPGVPELAPLAQTGAEAARQKEKRRGPDEEAILSKEALGRWTRDEAKASERARLGVCQSCQRVLCLSQSGPAALELIEAPDFAEEERASSGLLSLQWLLLHLDVGGPGALVTLRHAEGHNIALADAKAIQVVLQQEDVGPPGAELLRLLALDEAPALSKSGQNFLCCVSQSISSMRLAAPCGG